VLRMAFMCGECASHVVLGKKSTLPHFNKACVVFENEIGHNMVTKW
jgi:hypothetical protein